MQKKLCNVTLELSAKPFFDDSEAEMYRVCRKMFNQWRALTAVTESVSVLLWIADGSEILEYSGDLSQTFEWGYWCGCANHCPRHQPELPGDRENIHLYPQPYRAGVGPRSYAWLKRLIEVIRETGAEITGKPIRVGATFDNGPEFAISDFKFNRHKEIAQAHTLFPNSFVVCTAKLHAEKRAYAAFPDGIAEGTSLGRFLGSQFREFSRDLGYDYIWLSNGMGFGSETWGITGALFDKRAFHMEKADRAAEDMLDFWRDFYAGCPGVQVETRGSNYSAGTEIATDAAPLAKLYRDYKIAPPVNSPWASMNYNVGLEIAAWMSHIAELPDDRLPFRFYIHDPWFINSPWLDRYGREPWDIYLPLAVSRVSEDGTVKPANRIALLSVDDTKGQMPDIVPREVIPQLLHAALEIAPDAPGPLLWVYPFDEYAAKKNPHLAFAEEQFIGEAIQGGLPLNTVISTRIWR
ncbi:MAG: hypothetical protein PHI35_02280, partial [Victivallaceae bacterium]|nr:hypothetical protein [Victivallaceae bacterium]